MFLNGILSRKERELIERDSYNKSEYGGEYKDEFYYGNESVNEIVSEYDILENGYYIEEYIKD